MAITITKGLTVTRKLGAGYNTAGFNVYPITNGYGSNIGHGDPVKLSAGKIELATNAGAVIGVFAGCKFVDDEGRLQVKKNFVAGTSSKGGSTVEGDYTQPVAMVYDDPNQTFVIRTLTCVSAGALGKSFKVSAIGSVVGEQSQAVLDVAASAGTSGGHMVTIIGLWQEPNNTWDVSGGTAVEVKLSNYGIIGEL